MSKKQRDKEKLRAVGTMNQPQVQACPVHREIKVAKLNKCLFDYFFHFRVGP